MLEKTMLIKMNQQAYGTTMFQILTEDQIEQIYYAALDVLEISGARISHKAALKKFESSDAVVTDKDRVRVPTSLVEQALRSCPSKAALSDRNGTRSIKLQKNEWPLEVGRCHFCIRSQDCKTPRVHLCRCRVRC